MNKLSRLFLLFTFIPFFSFSQVDKSIIDHFLSDSAIRTGHAGISIYDPATATYLYNYNADKNFIPSSNVKLFTLYAGLKYLGDSITGMQVFERNDTLYFQPTGDPTFLHRDFSSQPAFDKLNGYKGKLVYPVFIKDSFAKYAPGWAWEDYTEDYMPERSRFPIYGNVISFYKEGNLLKSTPLVFKQPFIDEPMMSLLGRGKNFSFWRPPHSNRIYVNKATDNFTFQQLPFLTDEKLSLYPLQISFLEDSLHIENGLIGSKLSVEQFPWLKIESRPVDSLFRPMMYNSDNFFAEQTLLMVSNERFGLMNDAAIIDSLLSKDLKDLPNKPRWTDGSGLSRYNLFSPKDFIFILGKLKDEFGLPRMKRILPTAGQGTLSGYYAGLEGMIYAKTGSMSNNVSLSGYLLTANKRLLYFSVLVNNSAAKGRAIRRAIEKLLVAVQRTS